MAVNQVKFGNETIIDLTDATATASDIASGKTAYIATGEKVTGTGGGGISSIILPALQVIMDMNPSTQSSKVANAINCIYIPLTNLKSVTTGSCVISFTEGTKTFLQATAAFTDSFSESQSIGAAITLNKNSDNTITQQQITNAISNGATYLRIKLLINSFVGTQTLKAYMQNITLNY